MQKFCSKTKSLQQNEKNIGGLQQQQQQLLLQQKIFSLLTHRDRAVLLQCVTESQNMLGHVPVVRNAPTTVEKGERGKKREIHTLTQLSVFPISLQRGEIVTVNVAVPEWKFPGISTAAAPCSTLQHCSRGVEGSRGEEKRDSQLSFSPQLYKGVRSLLSPMQYLSGIFQGNSTAAAALQQYCRDGIFQEISTAAAGTAEKEYSNLIGTAAGDCSRGIFQCQGYWGVFP